MINDLRLALRTLRKSPGFTTVVLLTLALGIGANTAVFSLLYPVLLKPLPYPAPERLMSIQTTGSGGGKASYPDFVDWRAASRSFEQMSGFADGSAILAGAEEPLEARRLVVTEGFCDLLGIRPALGSCFDTAPSLSPGTRQVLLTHALWRRYFGSQLDVVGRTVHLDGVPFSIAGVLGRDWTSPLDERAVFTPAGGGDGMLITSLERSGEADEAETQRRDRASRSLSVVGRLRPGVSIPAAQAELAGVSSHLASVYPESNQGRGVVVQPLHTTLTADRRAMLGYLAASVALVLLIACANVAGLLLTRAMGREKELAVRLSLGATRGTLARQLLSEGFLLSAGGGLLGLSLAPLTAWVINSLATDPTQAIYDRPLDGVVLLFTLLASSGVALLCSVVPSLVVASVNIVEALKESGSSAPAGIGRRRAGQTLVTVEVALATALLMGSGLSLRSLWKIGGVPLGLRPENVLTMRFRWPGTSAQNAEHQLRLCQTVIRNVRAVPGVAAAGLGSMLPLSGTTGRAMGFRKEDGSPLEPQGGLAIDLVGSGYDAALGLRLLRGRWYTDEDIERNAAAVIVNESFARGYLGGVDVVGRKILGGGPLEIVGVIADIRHGGPTRAVSPRLYLPLSSARGLVWTHIVVRLNGPSSVVGDAVRREIRSVVPAAAVSRPRTMGQRLIADSADRRLMAILLSGFGGIALVLAAVGLYGTMAQFVARRVREMAVRITLGAHRKDVLALVLTEGLTITTIGVGLGAGIGAALVRLLRSQLFGITVSDPVTFGGVALVMAASAALAAYLPARRAAKVDPMVALRCE